MHTKLPLTVVEHCIFVTLSENCLIACACLYACAVAVKTATAGKIWPLFVFARDIL